jgi:uncharacterized protein YciI
MPFDENEANEIAESMNMAIYYVYLLKKGPTWTPEETPQINALQEAHMANFRRLHEMGKLMINGPLMDSLMDDGEIRGIGVLKADSLSEARELVSTDPMVNANRLIFEIHPWLVAKGILS